MERQLLEAHAEVQHRRRLPSTQITGSDGPLVLARGHRGERGCGCARWCGRWFDVGLRLCLTSTRTLMKGPKVDVGRVLALKSPVRRAASPIFYTTALFAIAPLQIRSRL